MTGSPGNNPGVIVCQIGAREHYAVARTLHKAGLLERMITDVWVPPSSALLHLPGQAGQRIRGRYHGDLSDAHVTHFTRSVIGREVWRAAIGQRSRWPAILTQNRSFQSNAVRHLKTAKAFDSVGSKPATLTYSYAARDILVLAREAGARTILCQIDGGPADEALIASLWSKRSGEMPDRAPPHYWEAWRDECQLADRIVVNSDWSKQLLIEAGIDGEKLVVIPVNYEQANDGVTACHAYPDAFSVERPLKVLVLGALTLRKGVMEALEAARILSARPVHFTFVGADGGGFGAGINRKPNTRWRGAVPRSEVTRCYSNADVLLFPTHSDGFGMVQIEALASGLPVIASRHCAAIVSHGRSGLVLDEVSAEMIARAVTVCLETPAMLADMSAEALRSGSVLAARSAKTFLETMRYLMGLELR